ncbi:sigma-54 interaction domain-containing protein [Anaerovorax sp. IOR16]|uniref:sigma-54 interaction domain-containing protein n=1 Tax=Anaerovorax sp. IOR16 TaxID=2773458 RepID=UPI0019D16BA9|nr:sigma 54-interacting transcriptional regulator [Anaerovorax sp. IOR16]
MLDYFGMNRVIEPKNTVPIVAWKLDNSRKLHSDEICIALRRVKMEPGSFRQICNECEYEEAKIHAKIYDIIRRRGKLHNPATDSGGMFYGVVEEINENYKNPLDLCVGEEVYAMTSLTALPLYIENIINIDLHSGILEVEGYAILFDYSPLLRCPVDLKYDFTMTALDESGSLCGVNRIVRGFKRVLLLGSDVMLLSLYASSLRKEMDSGCRLVAVLDEKSVDFLSKKEIEKALSPFFDKVYLLDVLSPLDSFSKIAEEEHELFDVSINCADLLGAEAISVLLTKEHGCLFFGSMSNNYNLGVLFAESIGKTLRTYSLDEYMAGYDEFILEMVRENKDQLIEIEKLYKKYPLGNEPSEKAIQILKFREVGKRDGFLYMSEKTKAMVDEVLNIASYDCNVVIHGETGVGKEKVLGLLQKNSSRKLNPCIKINCATIQENLAESEFFGYEAGAFTGASATGKKGYFELANNGILFLDEVADLPLGMQSKLLRVLQENQFYPIGGVKQISVNVRVICASNKNLRQLVENGKFREDLYYRLNICEINIPPLRERRDDIFCLTDAFLKKYNQRYGITKVIDTSAYTELYKYNWPGNVRELENFIHRLVINTRGNLIRDVDVNQALYKNLYDNTFVELTEGLINEEHLDFNTIIQNQEKRLIGYALEKEKNTRDAARYLGLSQTSLLRKKHKYLI